MQKSDFFRRPVGAFARLSFRPRPRAGSRGEGIAQRRPRRRFKSGTDDITGKPAAARRTKRSNLPSKAIRRAHRRKAHPADHGPGKRNPGPPRHAPKTGRSQKEVEKLQGKLAIVEGENAALSERVKTLESANDTLTAAGETAGRRQRPVDRTNAGFTNDAETRKQITANKPAFVKSAVEFYNYESHPVKMNVNGVWHTLKARQKHNPRALRPRANPPLHQCRPPHLHRLDPRPRRLRHAIRRGDSVNFKQLRM